LDGIVDVFVRIKTGTPFKRKYRLLAASEEYNPVQDRRRLRFDFHISCSFFIESALSF